MPTEFTLCMRVLVSSFTNETFGLKGQDMHSCLHQISVVGNDFLASETGIRVLAPEFGNALPIGIRVGIRAGIRVGNTLAIGIRVGTRVGVRVGNWHLLIFATTHEDVWKSISSLVKFSQV